MIIDELAIFIIVVIGLYDLVLILSYKPTISQAYQRLFPTWVDMIVLAALIVGVCFLPISYILKVLLGAIAGHVCWPNKERWGG